MMLSRLADNLYWLSRYLERAECTARVLELHSTQMIDQSSESAEKRWERIWKGLLLDDYFGTVFTEEEIYHALTVERFYNGSIMHAISMARHNAMQIREHISSEFWLNLNRMYHRVLQLVESGQEMPPEFLIDVVADGVHLLRGIAGSTMMHGESWHYLQLGRYIERSLLHSAILQTHITYLEEGLSVLEWVGLLRSCLSLEPYIATYSADFPPKQVAQFLLFHPDSPRSIRFASDQIYYSLKQISQHTRIEGVPQRLAGKVQAHLRYTIIDDIVDHQLVNYLKEVRSLCEEINNAIYQVYINPTLQTEQRQTEGVTTK